MVAPDVSPSVEGPLYPVFGAHDSLEVESLDVESWDVKSLDVTDD